MVKIYKRGSSASLIKEMASAGRQYVSSIYGGGMGVVVDVYPTNFFEDSRPSRLGGYSLNGLIP